MHKVALIGRPNVGKSTLFNRLIRSKRAITHDIPGITRDRMEGIIVRDGERICTIIDTGGITLDHNSILLEGPEGIRGFETEILQHAQVAIEESSLLCLVVDAKTGLLPTDSYIAQYLRKTGKKILLLVNKVDGIELEDTLSADFYELGLPFICVSAEHNMNIKLLEEQILEKLPNEEKTIREEYSLKIALLGKPNAGKSSLINALLQEERMIVSDKAGTTRDSVDVYIKREGKTYLFVDTAGVRKKNKIDDSIERYSVNSSIKSTTKADITLLIVDAVEGITLQDKRLLSLLCEKKIPVFIIVNKIDMLNKKERKMREQDCKDLLCIAPYIPVVYISALERTGIRSILPMAEKIHSEMITRIGTGLLNRAFTEILERHQPPIIKNARPKFFYLTQAGINPPTFVFFVSDSTRVLESYTRYVDKSLRERFSILHAPIRIHFRSSHTKRKKN
ncbi:MAG: ribosome biogenesis GTPase Der [Desulfovibrionaceae bacterium]